MFKYIYIYIYIYLYNIYICICILRMYLKDSQGIHPTSPVFNSFPVFGPVLLLLELVHPGDHLHHLLVLVLLAATHALLLSRFHR